MHKFLYLLFVLLLFLLLQIFHGCQLIENEPAQIVIDSEYIQLEWDPPSVNEKDVSPIVSYRVYYRIHGMTNWRLLDVIPAEQNPTYTIYHSELGNGSYDFAVRAITSDNRVSNLHSSLDYAADPIGGWYIVWIRFEDED